MTHITPAQAREALTQALRKAGGVMMTESPIDTVRQFIQQYEQMEAALKPFVDEGAWEELWPDDAHYDRPDGYLSCFTVGDLRRAAAATKGE